MSADILSQAERESLLSSMEGQGLPGVPTRRGSSAAAGDNRHAGTPTQHGGQLLGHVSQEQMRALRTMHEGVGNRFATALASLLRTSVEARLTGVDQLTYSDFVFDLEAPTCFALIDAQPLEGTIILDIDPSILFPIIDRLLGGKSESSAPQRRPLTEIELRLVSRIIGLFLGELKHAWSDVVDLTFDVKRVESNPHLVQIVPPNEVMVLIGLGLTIADAQGMMNLGIPYHLIQRHGEQLVSDSHADDTNRLPAAESMQQVSSRLGESRVELVVELATTRISTSDFLGLQVGDIIATEKDIRGPLVVTIDGRPKFRAQPGAFNGHKAIQVVEPIAARHE